VLNDLKSSYLQDCLARARHEFGLFPLILQVESGLKANLAIIIKKFKLI